MSASPGSSCDFAIGEVGSVRQFLIDSSHHPDKFVDSVKKHGNYFAEADSQNGKGSVTRTAVENLTNLSTRVATLSYSMYYSHFTPTAPIFKSHFQSSTYLQEEAYGTR
jgi:hypothetical protein